MMDLLLMGFLLLLSTWYIVMKCERTIKPYISPYMQFYIYNPKFRIVDEDQLAGVELRVNKDLLIGDCIRLDHTYDDIKSQHSIVADVTKVRYYKSADTARRYVGIENIASDYHDPSEFHNLLDTNIQDIKKYGIAAIHWETDIPDMTKIN